MNSKRYIVLFSLTAVLVTAVLWLRFDGRPTAVASVAEPVEQAAAETVAVAEPESQPAVAAQPIAYTFAADTAVVETETETTSLVGSSSDPDLILATVSQFVEQQKALLTAVDSGWVYLSHTLDNYEQSNSEPIYRFANGNSVDKESLIPSRAVLEYWYHLEAPGRFFESVATSSSAEGYVAQQTVTIGLRRIHLSLKAAGASPSQYGSQADNNEITLSIEQVLDNINRGTDNPRVQFEASWADGRYVVTRTATLETPSMPEATGMPEPVIAIRTVSAFDHETGQLLSHDGYSLFESAGWQQTVHQAYAPITFHAQPPVTILNVLNEGTKEMNGESE